MVSRDCDGEIYAFENRCAHPGALICLDSHGKGRKDFSCVYHAWTYRTKGDLIGVAFKDGIKGEGGTPDTFRMQGHNPPKLRIAVVHGLVFGSFSEDVPPIEEYLGDEILSRIERVVGKRTPVVLAQNASAEELALLSAVQRPISPACITVPVNRPLWKDRPTWFLIAEENRMIVPDTQRFMAERMHARVRSHPVDHRPIVTAPGLVVDIVTEAIGEEIRGDRRRFVGAASGTMRCGYALAQLAQSGCNPP